ncbi:hypothetical protein QFZ37_001214 [Chryseobacterium ginsenosidimutans]|uniref:hypothetical protein n=1 Tax=Chryseobacterium ginsenosidimutans TaxID=687846 RepID=UPI002783EA4E|nr:hypothetical protein [Chryseobacterium ginsenosidimutans]MDQ0592845.1 hypothetical protein [Chryseobacterium ginsenosidimutans]
MKNLQVPNPCSENWELMSPQEKGRFCSVCSKCVIDFTQKHPQEIQQIFAERKDENICGRFYSDQLTNNEAKSEKIKTQFFKYIPSYFQNNRLTLALFSLILFLTGCSKQKEESCTMTTGVAVVDLEIDTIKNKDFVMGEPLAIENDSVAKIHKKDSIALKKRSSK